MSCLAGDILLGQVTPGVGNAAINAVGKLLKVNEMAHRYGVAGSDGAKQLILASGDDDARSQRISQLKEELAALDAA